MKNDELLIFDLDDTLVDTSEVYYRARRRFLEVLGKNEIDTDMAVKMFEEIDSSHIERFGFSPERYGMSMLVTYETIAKKKGVRRSEETIKKIKSCGRMVLKEYPELIGEARELLGWASENFILALLTRGIYELQMKKIDHVGISKYFRCIEVVKEKNGLTVNRLIDRVGMKPASTWVIGDSIKSDVNPGIEAGTKCILYFYTHHSYRWEQEYTGSQAKGPFYKANGLLEIKEILKSPKDFEMIRSLT